MVGEIPELKPQNWLFRQLKTDDSCFPPFRPMMRPPRIVRLLDMGVDASVIADSLVAVIGQRLVREICDKCKIPDPLTPQIFEQLDSVIQPDRAKKFWKGAGCEACQYSGYMGRLGIFEIFMITPAIREILARCCRGCCRGSPPQSRGCGRLYDTENGWHRQSLHGTDHD